ncbi:hypothetical protein [Nocardiopsis nanhaiensis]
MQNSSGGRHRKPRESMASRLWWVFASAVAWTSAQVIGAPTRTEPRPVLVAAPRRLELAPAPVCTHRMPVQVWADPDEVAGALVRPYLLRQ